MTETLTLKKLKLIILSPVLLPTHNFIVLTGRIAYWYAKWAERNTTDEYLIQYLIKRIFNKNI